MRALITGGAGFIGSAIVRRLWNSVNDVVVYDRKDGQDILHRDLLDEYMEGTDVVFHMAARADLRLNVTEPRSVYENNVIGTLNVLEAMRKTGTKKIVFASTGSVYGEPTVFPTPEDAPFPQQTSIYAASKLAGEGLIEAYAEAFGIEAYIFRFVSNVGEGYSHGHVLDFYKKLKADPHKIQVLGNGKQRKSYVYVEDTVDAIMCALEHAKDRVNIFNVGTNDYCTVMDSLGWIARRMGVEPVVTAAGGERGWVGDSPLIHLHCGRLRVLGWVPKLTIQQGIERTVDWFIEEGM